MRDAISPINQLSVTCQCGVKQYVTASQAGSTQTCSACHRKLAIPKLSDLKKQPAGSAIGLSKLDQLFRSIENRESPFDGNCQLCSQARGDNFLPVTVYYFDDEEEQRGFSIPCNFCDLCAGDVRSGLRRGVLKGLLNNLAKCLWLLVMLLIVIFIAVVLPLIGFFFVLAMMSALVYQVTRRRANPFVLMHLERICDFTDVMEGIEEYVVKQGRMESMPAYRRSL